MRFGMITGNYKRSSNAINIQSPPPPHIYYKIYCNWLRGCQRTIDGECKET